MRRKAGEPGWQDATRQAAELLSELDHLPPHPVYVISGEDSFQRMGLTTQLVDKLVPVEQRQLGLTTVDGSQVSARQVAGELESSGFRFDDDPRRVVLVRRCPYFQAGDGDDHEPLRKRLEAGLLDDTVVIFEVEGKVDKRLALSKTVLSLARAVEFPALAEGFEVEQFIKARLAEADVTMERRAFGELTARCGQDARRLTNELDKLICAIDGRGEIRVDDVRSMVAPTAELSVFDLVDAVAERKPREAVSQLEALLDQQAQPFMILAMLSRQMRLLIQARYLLDAKLLNDRELRMRPYDFGQLLGRANDERSLLAKLKREVDGILPTAGKSSILSQHYYPFWKSLQVAARIDADTLAAGHARLLQTDLALKSSHLEPRQELELLIIDLCVRMEAGATVDYDRLLET